MLFRSVVLCESVGIACPELNIDFENRALIREEPCDFNNPLTDLPWLKEIVDAAEAGATEYLRIYQCDYRDGIGFLMELFSEASEFEYSFRNCKGVVLCEDEGIACPKLNINFENKELMWERACYFINPLTDLPWLKEFIENTEVEPTYKGIKISQYNYKDGIGFWIEYCCYPCFEYSGEFRNFEGEILVNFYGYFTHEWEELNIDYSTDKLILQKDGALDKVLWDSFWKLKSITKHPANGIPVISDYSQYNLIYNFQKNNYLLIYSEDADQSYYSEIPKKGYHSYRTTSSCVEPDRITIGDIAFVLYYYEEVMELIHKSNEDSGYSSYILTKIR